MITLVYSLSNPFARISLRTSHCFLATSLYSLCPLYSLVLSPSQWRSSPLYSLVVTILLVSSLYSLVLCSIRLGHYSLMFVLYSLVTTCGILLSKSCITWNSSYQCSMAVYLSTVNSLFFILVVPSNLGWDNNFPTSSSIALEYLDISTLLKKQPMHSPHRVSVTEIVS